MIDHDGILNQLLQLMKYIYIGLELSGTFNYNCNYSYISQRAAFLSNHCYF